MAPKVISTKTRACEHSHRSILIDTYTYPDKLTDQSKLPVTLDEDDLFNDFWDTLPKCLQDEFVNAVEILEKNAKNANIEVLQFFLIFISHSLQYYYYLHLFTFRKH